MEKLLNEEIKNSPLQIEKEACFNKFKNEYKLEDLDYEHALTVSVLMENQKLINEYLVDKPPQYFQYHSISWVRKIFGEGLWIKDLIHFDAMLGPMTILDESKFPQKIEIAANTHRLKTRYEENEEIHQQVQAEIIQEILLDLTKTAVDFSLPSWVDESDTIDLSKITNQNDYKAYANLTAIEKNLKQDWVLCDNNTPEETVNNYNLKIFRADLPNKDYIYFGSQNDYSYLSYVPLSCCFIGEHYGHGMITRYAKKLHNPVRKLKISEI